MTTNLFVIPNVKQLKTDGSFRILLPFFRTSWGVGLLNSALFNSFHNRVDFGTILEVLRNFEGGGSTLQTAPLRYATDFGEGSAELARGPQYSQDRETLLWKSLTYQNCHEIKLQ